jgi:Methylase involved in ubiquinone/menaquinone biosynthesis
MFRTRSAQLELIDTGDYTSEEYEGCLCELRRVNRFLGDARALKKSLLREIEKSGLKNFSALDLGAGSGELLRVCAGFAKAKKIRARLFGVELNARSAEAIRRESKPFENIFSVRADAFRLPFADGEFDYAFCSLFTHHFPDEKILEILCEMKRVARRKIFVIDLHRHPAAYYFYISAGRIFLRNRLVRHDGALSILRSFKPAELLALAEKANLKNASVKRCFPYRLILESGV